MNVKKLCRLLGCLMLLGAAVFICYALGHPEGSFPISITLTRLIYGLYMLVAFVLLALSFPARKK